MHTYYSKDDSCQSFINANSHGQKQMNNVLKTQTRRLKVNNDDLINFVIKLTKYLG